MNARGRHPSGGAARRLTVTAVVSVSIVLISIGWAVAAVRPATPPAAVLRSADVTGTGGTAQPGTPQPGTAQPGTAQPGTGQARTGQGTWEKSEWGLSTRSASVPLTLTVQDRQACPASATACVDLTRHITWLQADGQVTFGPVQMEPGPPGTASATPAGTFQVAWKAGPNYVSTTYHEAMPWATFFAPGGIAFHGGSLTTWSHGCVHLTVANAHYYNEHLPVGAEVVVF
jgi:lipoprotein-anchoring transpeptidase ErfK/SrfK